RGALRHRSTLVQTHRQGAYRRAALTLARPTGFVGPVSDSATGQRYQTPLLTAFHLGPRAGTHTVNFRFLHFQGEELGKHIGWRVDRRIIADFFAHQRHGGLVTVGVVDVVADVGNHF